MKWQNTKLSKKDTLDVSLIAESAIYSIKNQRKFFGISHMSVDPIVK
jgi:hypothetical protein